MITKKKVLEYSKNLIGFRTKRKIVVLESDDWGSIRTRSKRDYLSMLEGGLNVDQNSYTMYDCLESNSDLELLYNVLSSHKDSTGRHPVMTPMYIMANPNFEKIEEHNFNKYYFEHFLETAKKYPNTDKIGEIIKEGIEKRIFVPALHGREHLNAPRWMRLLKTGNKGVRLAFKHQSIGATSFKGKNLPCQLEAFNPEFPEDIEHINQSLVDSVAMFHSTFGYKPEHFIEPNTFGTKDFEKVLHENGLKYLLRGKLTKYAKINNKKTRPYFHWVGEVNKYGQIFLTRNCTFEPHRPLDLNDVVEACMNDIDVAFKLQKPALIISHRASYVGSISVENRSNGLDKLNSLLTQIIKKWPDVEFMTSMELGELIAERNK
jgi:hypothetical protein